VTSVYWTDGTRRSSPVGPESNCAVQLWDTAWIFSVQQHRMLTGKETQNDLP
jgi:squalene cyclase